MTRTPDEILGLATQAVKEVMVANTYVRPVTSHNSHEIHDLLKPRGKQLLGSFESHQPMMDGLAEIRAERIVKKAAEVFLKNLSDEARASNGAGTFVYMTFMGEDGTLEAIPIEYREFFADSIDAFNSAIQEGSS